MHKTFRFTFVDETGVDAGGLAREWFSLIIEVGGHAAASCGVCTLPLTRLEDVVFVVVVG